MNNDDQTRITLSIAFIATYLTIILGYSDNIKEIFMNYDIPKLFSDIFFYIFIVYGLWVVCLFFLYLIFSALFLTTNKTKELILDVEISNKRIKELKIKFFNWGVRWILLSFTSPIYYIMGYCLDNYNLWIAILVFFYMHTFIYLILLLICRDKKVKRKVNKKIKSKK